MKIKIQRESFLSSLQTAAMVAPARSPKPILQHVKLEAGDSGGVLSATDQEIGIRLVVDQITVDQPGQCVIPVDRVRSILRESNDDEIELSVAKGKAKIKTSSSKFELQVHNADEFPELSAFDGDDYLQVESAALTESIRRTIFAADVDSRQYAMSGVLLVPDSDKLILVATDGRRMAKSEIGMTKIGKPEDPITTIVPTKSMQLISRIFSGDDPVQLLIRNNEVLIRNSKACFFSRLVEGRFPKWREVIPNRTDSEVIPMSVGPTFSAIRQAAIVAAEESRGVDFTFGGGMLLLENETAEVGDSRVELPVSYDGDSIKVTLDHRFMEDFLKVLSPDAAFSFDVKDSTAAVLCETDDNYGYLVMPLDKKRSA